METQLMPARKEKTGEDEKRPAAATHRVDKAKAAQYGKRMKVVRHLVL